MLMERACGCKSRVRGGRRRAVARHEHGARAAAAALELGARARHDECRRCAPGRAAAPELVIADEPTSALDPDVRQSFLDLVFEEVATNRSTLVFVSHDARLEAAFDRVIALSEVNRASPLE